MTQSQLRSNLASMAWPNERDACGVGFIADLQRRPGRRVLEHALEALSNLAHRGAVSADGLTGDGAGILTQLPYRILQRELSDQGHGGISDDEIAVGVFFFSNDSDDDALRGIAEGIIDDSAVELLMWRVPPTHDGALGALALERRPVIRHAIVRKQAKLDRMAFERELFAVRKKIERAFADAGQGRAYIPSFSSRTIVYKGLMVADQLAAFYRDLADPDFETTLAVFHQRYSTNTVPRWSLAQPFRMLAHNGEINTLQGNVNLMAAREPVLSSEIWGDAIEDLKPVIAPGASDSSALDNTLEMLSLSGRDSLHSLAMLVPPAFEGDDAMDPDVRAFYRYHAGIMEPWDGPAALAVSDGVRAIAALDRNGLRPQRYHVTESGLVIVGSEAGMIHLPSDTIIERGRLGPGQMLAVDTERGVLLKDEDLKRELAAANPYREWVEQRLLEPPAFSSYESASGSDEGRIVRQSAAGYVSEDIDRIFEPMALSGNIPVGSMGDDTPLAVLSEQPQQLWRYFKQRFAQVTNPPIDPYRERLVMSLQTTVGPRGALLDDKPSNAAVMRFSSPIVDEQRMAWMAEQDNVTLDTVDTTFAVGDGPEGLKPALERIEAEAVEAAKAGATAIVLSDRETSPQRAAVPSLLATGAVHHALIRAGMRTRTAIIVESAEPREDHHFALLIGYGAALVHPYLALDTARHLADGADDPITPDAAASQYVHAVEQGLLKIMSKMGISTISSYRSAQIFEAIGIDEAVINRYFTGTFTHMGGASLETIASDTLALHAEGYGEDPALVDRGIYRYRKNGEYHALNPLVFKALHKAVRNEDQEAFDQYTELVDGRPPTALRDLLEPQAFGEPVPLDEVEPIESIVQRFTTQAMSHGSVSRETHETLAIAMNRIGAMSNSGEGGEDPERFTPYERDREDRSLAPWHPKEGDLANSAIKQVASGRFGVTAHYLSTAKEIEIKMAQGSKPGEGGQIPGFKVSEEIGRIRHSVPGVTLISPPPHHDIYSIEDLAQLIHDLKRVQKDARIGVKLVSTYGVGTIAAGVAKGYADNIQISGFDGGTGASPLSSIKHAGAPWELGLAETQKALVENGLRDRITLRVDGGLKTGRDVLIGAMLGAERFGFGTSALVAAGCAMIRQCHLNTCPVGVATQREDLRARYVGQPEHVVRMMGFVAQHVRILLSQLGVRSLDEVIGRMDMLAAKEVELPRGTQVNLAPLLATSYNPSEEPRIHAQLRNDRPDAEPFDDQLWEDVRSDLEEFGRSDRHYVTTNRYRVIGGRLSGEIAKQNGPDGLPEGTVRLRFEGPVGQSFGAFLVSGVHLDLRGDAQDYVGKGMSGGVIGLRSVTHNPGKRSALLGNTVLYGATGGSLFAAGAAGERLAVRNSGAHAVVEGCGDHGCEYMTGGTVVVLGETGRNFAAGMSGGLAFVYDPNNVFEGRYNPSMVELKRLKVGMADEQLLHELLERHVAATESVLASTILSDWSNALEAFWRVAPSQLPAQDDVTDPGLWFAERSLGALHVTTP